MQKLLNKAKKYQKKKEWENAASCYEQYIEKSEGECEDDVYISYAVCLRRSGNTTRAKETLLKVQELSPTNDHILKELLNLYNAINDKLSAINVAKDLVKLNPSNSNNHFKLGESYAQLNKFEEAKTSFLYGLESHHEMSIEALKKEIQSGFVKSKEEASAEYIFLGGRGNYGSFLHNYQGKKLFTKISRHTLRAKRERVFYREICQSFPVLKKYVPAYFGSKVIDNILYLTIEMIESTTSSIEPIEDILSTSQGISSIPYEKIAKEYPNLNYSFQLKNKPNPMIIYFTKIHEKYYNEKLFTSFYKLMEQNNYPDAVYYVIQQLESFIMDNHLYEFIHPDEHYSLVHGDYNKSNSKIDKQDNTIKVFDWELFKIGPHFIDIVRYLSGTLVSYLDVKKIYLNNKELGGKLSLIEKIFFLYALILLYILTLGENKVEKEIDKYITPALHDMESLIEQFTKTDYFSSVQQLLNENNENEAKILKLLNKNDENEAKTLQLEEDNLRLKKKKNELEILHENFVKSKSWKITAPFRKFTQLINKIK